MHQFENVYEIDTLYEYSEFFFYFFGIFTISVPTCEAKNAKLLRTRSVCLVKVILF